jgi:multimeric flavodoxin WrbA
VKVVAFNGSARKDGNTAILIQRVLQVLEAEGIETELIQLAGEQIRGCNLAEPAIPLRTNGA